ncbi:MAG: M20/M25/M40 family metallo-hydrolase, partial [Woeseiaceae bacterium]|nr:M20/M25/M40 family metallo-hydrolase [Woeseiaceae bacterium]
MRRSGLIACGIAWLCAGTALADEGHFATQILRELIAFNTAPSGGDDLRPTMAYVEGLLRDAGFTDEDIDIVTPAEKLPNLVVRYKSGNPQRDPILMMAHLDVVEALPEDWTVPPFEMTELDGHYYGRGTNDNKAGGAMLVANLIRMKQEDFEPDRDLIVMLTADEETTGAGAIALTTEYRHLIDAEFALNTDGGGVMLAGGEPRAFIMQTAEKVYVDFLLEATDPGGHSSVPRADSAIARMARTIVALSEHRFPIDLNETTRTFFERWRDFAPEEDAELIGALLADAPDEEISADLDAHPYYNSLARTTCIVTQVHGGHAINAIPQRATATVNCRILPQFSNASAAGVITAAAAANDISVEQIYPYRPSPPSPLTPNVVNPIGELAEEFWPGIVLIPEMSTGATDGLFVRNAGIPVYAISAIAEEPDDIRAHGQDERIGIEAFEVATEYWYRLVRKLSTPAADPAP